MHYSLLSLVDYPFGLLENCNHAFCVLCIASYRRVHSSTNCPVCCTDSGRVLIWPKWLESPKHKKTLLRFQENINVDKGTFNFTLRGPMREPVQILFEYPLVRLLLITGCVFFVIAILLDIVLHSLNLMD